MVKLLSKRGIFSLLLSGVMAFTQASMVFAEDVAEDTTSDTVTYTLSPENYAIAHLSTTGYSSHVSKAKTLSVYYNTVYSSGSTYTEFGSIISTYKAPIKNAVADMGITYDLKTDSNTTTSRYVPVFYDLNKFSLNAENGLYESDTSTYAAVTEYASNYWTTTGTTSHSLSSSLAFYNQIAFKITEKSLSSGAYKYDASTALAAYKNDATAEYITFATGREVSGYTNAYLNLKNDTQIPYLTLTYSKSALATEVNNTTDVSATLADLNTIGALADTTNGYDGYTALTADEKAYVNGVIAETVYTDWASFCTAYDALIENPSAPAETVTATFTEDFTDTEATDAATGASIWAGEIEGTGASFKTITATVTNTDDEVATGTADVSTITTTGDVTVVIVVNRMKDLIKSVVLSVE